MFLLQFEARAKELADSRKVHSSVMVDQVVYHHEQRDELLAALRNHLFHTVVRWWAGLLDASCSSHPRSFCA